MTHLDFTEIDTALPGDPRERRRMVVASGLRILVTTLGLLILYAVVPVPGTSGIGALIAMLGGLVAFTALVAWQIITIWRAEHPLLRAVEVVAVALPLLIVVFAFIYVSISRADAATFSEHLDRVDAVYFTVSTFSTVGFGDIAASSAEARILVTVQMLFDLALIAGLVRVVVLVTRSGLRRKSAGG